jgi:hypothetical protein
MICVFLSRDRWTAARLPTCTNHITTVMSRVLQRYYSRRLESCTQQLSLTLRCSHRSYTMRETSASACKCFIFPQKQRLSAPRNVYALVLRKVVIATFWVHRSRSVFRRRTEKAPFKNCTNMHIYTYMCVCVCAFASHNAYKKNTLL